MWTEGRGAGGAFVRSWGVGGRGERGVAGRGRRVLVGRSGGPGGAGTGGCAPGGASTHGCRRPARARGARARLFLRVRAPARRRPAQPSARRAVRRRRDGGRRLPGATGAGVAAAVATLRVGDDDVSAPGFSLGGDGPAEAETRPVSFTVAAHHWERELEASEVFPFETLTVVVRVDARCVTPPHVDAEPAHRVEGFVARFSGGE